MGLQYINMLRHCHLVCSANCEFPSEIADMLSMLFLQELGAAVQSHGLLEESDWEEVTASTRRASAQAATPAQLGQVEHQVQPLAASCCACRLPKNLHFHEFSFTKKKTRIVTASTSATIRGECRPEWRCP